MDDYPVVSEEAAERRASQRKPWMSTDESLDEQTVLIHLIGAATPVFGPTSAQET
jgi:hypothetical protein